MSRRSASFLLALVHCLLLAAGRAPAATVEPLTIDDLAVRAEHVVLGTVQQVASRWNDDRLLIVTDVQVAITTTLKGEHRQDARLEMIGGVVDGITLRSTDTPVFESGDTVLLFLDASQQLVGSFQGAFFTDGDVVARAEPAVHAIDRTQLVPLRDVADAIAAAIDAPPVDDAALRLPAPSMPDQQRYDLFGADWAYQAEPMGESYAINPNASDGSAGPVQNQISAIFLGSSAWTDAGADFEFDFEGTTNSTADALDGENNVFFCPAGNCGMAPTTLATTHIWFVGGNIIEWDIIFNDQTHSFWDGQTGGCAGIYDIQAVAAHEFGHALGLGHSLDSDATMWFSVPPCETGPRDLDQDDIDGLVAIYGGEPEVPFLFTGEQAGDRLGFAVAGAGDVDNDGVEDVIVGAPYNDDNGADAGKVYVYSGATGTLIFEIAGDNPGYAFGWAVDGAGDVNGDGWDDVIVGAPYASGRRGRVYVYSGRDASLLYRRNGRSGTSERFGWSVAGGFDADADGFSDFLIGAPHANDAGTRAGKVRLFSGVDGAMLGEFFGEEPGDEFGTAVAGIGRTNGDDHHEFIVGAPGNDDAGEQAGKVYIYSGRHLRTFYTLTGVQADGRFGTSVAGVGFVDDDDKGDFIVASPYYDRGAKGEAGRIDLFSGRYGDRLYSKKGEDERDRLGWSVAGAGDVDGDGSADIAIGAPRHSAAGNKAGRVYIRSGATGGTIATFDGDASGDQLGYAVGATADVDDDDLPELVMGAPYNDLSAGKAGRLYLDLSSDRVALSAGDAEADDRVDANAGPGAFHRARGLRLLKAWLHDELLADVNGDDVVDEHDLDWIVFDIR